MLRLHDSLQGKVLPFRPQDPDRVRVYGCGPTVYDFAHIGNFRAFVFYDVLHRHLRGLGYGVEFVMNFTDVDDKTIGGAVAAGCSLAEHTPQFEEAFLRDSATLGILEATRRPRATEFISEMKRFVERLIDKGHAYQATDGSVYFRVSTVEEYGRFAPERAMEDVRSRIGEDAGKEDPRDFALWKAAREEDLEANAAWSSPWGEGRPGWHLECSVMATELLGATVDIHLGGEDLAFPHHENEIAQSEGATGARFVNYWLHVKHLKLDRRKMAKSRGNFLTVPGVLERGHSPASLRWLLLATHYRRTLSFSEAGLGEARQQVQRLLNLHRRITDAPEGDGPPLAEVASSGRRSFRQAMNDDLNTPRAISALWTMARRVNARLDEGAGISSEDRTELLAALAEMDAVLGVLDLARSASSATADKALEIDALVGARAAARARRDFKRADAIRRQLDAMGVQLQDSPSGTRWTLVD